MYRSLDRGWLSRIPSNEGGTSLTQAAVVRRKEKNGYVGNEDGVVLSDF